MYAVPGITGKGQIGRDGNFFRIHHAAVYLILRDIFPELPQKLQPQLRWERFDQLRRQIYLHTVRYELAETLF